MTKKKAGGLRVLYRKNRIYLKKSSGDGKDVSIGEVSPGNRNRFLKSLPRPGFWNR